MWHWASVCGHITLLFVRSIVLACSYVLVDVCVVVGETSNTFFHDTMLRLVGAEDESSRTQLQAVLQLLPDHSLAECMCCAAVVASCAVRVWRTNHVYLADDIFLTWLR